MKSHKFMGFLVGAALGLCAPLGSIVLRLAATHPHSVEIIANELQRNGYFYAYMTLATPLFFGLFGLALGYLLDQTRTQKEALEYVNGLLKQQSITDDLTGLYNRRHILDELDKEIERASRYKHPLSGMMIDLDNFKSVNDRFGHPTGDRFLREVAAVLSQSIRKIDIIGRYGGDEFLVVLPEADAAAAQVIAQRLQKSLSDYDFKAKGVPVQLRLSIGLASCGPDKSVDAEAFLETADSLLMRAKQGGRGKVVSG